MVGCSPDGEVMLWAGMASELMHGSSFFPDSQQAQLHACHPSGRQLRCAAVALAFPASQPGEAPDATAELIPASPWETSSHHRVEGQTDGSHGSFQPICIITLCSP